MPVNTQLTILGPKTVIRDNSILVDEELLIEGSVSVKKIEMSNHPLIIGLGADVTVETEVFASEIIVLGRIRANLRAVKEIQVGARGVVEGNLSAPRIKLDPTASVTGVLRH